ncbi:hypothetical protein [Microbacterium deminutum]|uniref:Uncharacterized protein n=1 Tax=Microbacterium deminutum TaxID=344164 RepID=A0ABP5CKV7_9MICO
MPQRLLFSDARAASDALTFAGRAGPLGDGGVRLQAVGGTLAMTSAPLAPRGLLDSTPTVLGMRMLPVDPELVCDVVVEASTLVAAADDPASIELPDIGLAPSWAGVSPPRSGWSAQPGLEASILAARAQWGIAAVAQSMPQNPGEDAVRAVRASIWGAADEALGGLPLGTAFAAFALGFIVGEEVARVLTSGPWTRVSLARGHVIVRGPAKMGMTDVRSTGAPRP